MLLIGHLPNTVFFSFQFFFKLRHRKKKKKIKKEKKDFDQNVNRFLVAAAMMDRFALILCTYKEHCVN